MQGGLFEKARAAAEGDPVLQQYVQQHHAQHLVAARDAEGLASAGNAAQAVELFAQRGDWERVHELAAQAGPDAQARYAVRWGRVGHWGLLTTESAHSAGWAAAKATIPVRRTA